MDFKMFEAGWNQRDKIFQENGSPTENDNRDLQIAQVLLALKATIYS